ncbi:hypothetical protein CKO44_18905 [Rubrivivax gelatinosus]|uniref:chemotaxis protein CheB n=1 Tax=Rubrivivax gelatinosus TaxID=28068 RepID=UPI00190376FD|nr:chemotaxis protein CheB [Rubrivivax gelatinosus]MBK1615535.1 hypothetical protein [Rubrivivax gelatinosus]
MQLPSTRLVGIGASSGGLEPILEIVSRLPADAGLALLVVQHLDPSQPSLLVDILAQHTTMTVEAAAEGSEVQAGHIYVIEPNTTMSVVQGRLSIASRVPRLGPPMPIDDLLESLARECESDAIGIVLSGAGTDGALGLQAVKAFGGLTFAQDEASARFASMPHAAIGLGCVDRVLPPERIAEELLRIVRHPLQAAGDGDAWPPSVGMGDEDGLRRLFRELHTTCNIDFSHYKRGTIQRRLARRLALHDVGELGAYLDLLEADPAETQALCRDLLIRYTEFFRDPDVFEALARTALPRLLQPGASANPLRIWVPGCATGEEVYSIAICVAEYLSLHAPAQPVQIFGTDVSDDALQTARTGCYIENIARNVSAERLARYFVRDGDSFRVNKSIRDCCTFARQNVAYDPPFSRLDLISCRNLLIYLDPVLQKRVMPAFHFALRREGILMLGASESVGAFSEFFTPIDVPRAKLFEKKTLANRPFTALALAAPVPPPTAAPGARADPEPREVDTPDTLRREVDRIALARFVPPCVLCDDAFNVIEYRGDTSPFLVNPGGAPTQQLRRLARPGVFHAVGEALREARASGRTVRRGGLRVTLDGHARDASLEVTPVQSARLQGRAFLVFFIASGQPAAAHGRPPALLRDLAANVVSWVGDRGQRTARTALEREVVRLNAELGAVREQTRVMLEEHELAIEELKTLEEEAQSSNEEFQSTNEELETAKEELQSLNEELSTTNDELRYRNRELKVLHERVTQARDFADAIIETTSQPLLVLDAALRVLRANQAFYDSFHSTPRETLQVPLFALGSGQWDIPELRRLLEDVMPQRTRVRDHEISAVFPLLGRRRVMLNAARVVYPDSTTILLTMDDVTERQETLDALSKADRQKDEFLAMLAHELRNPLAGMSNALHLLQHPGADTAQRAAAIAMLARQLRNQVRMVDDLLDVSRITRGLVDLQRARLDLARVVRQACDGLQSQIEARGHALALSLPPQGLMVDGDPVRLEQVAANLIGNAVKYTPAGGHIEVRLAADGDDAVLSVADDGLGMAPQLVEDAFKLFVRGGSSMHIDGGGLGIGLSVVRRIMELHGGTVSARSAGPDRGSCFVARMPRLVREVATPAAPSAGAPAAAPSGGHRVLVLDDNADAGDSIASLLALEGFSVRVTQDGDQALEVAAAFLPDAAVVDLGLPGMDGFEVCRRLRAMPALHGLLIIVVSGFGRPQDVLAAREAGADDHLTKPADPQRIADLVRRGPAAPDGHDAPALSSNAP